MMVLPFRSSDDVDSALPVVAAHLERGGLLAYPTETVYGLGSRLESNCLKALTEMTRRPDDKPFLVLVTNERMAVEYGLSFNRAAEILAARFWPGPLTLVLPAERSTLPKEVMGTEGGVAVRRSSHSETSKLIERLGIPVSSTSANYSGQTPLTTVADIREEFVEHVRSGDLILLDGGTLPKAPSSTLVDCTRIEPRILREGAVEARAVEECLLEAAG